MFCRKLAAEHGISAQICQSVAVKRSLTFPEQSIKQPRVEVAQHQEDNTDSADNASTSDLIITTTPSPTGSKSSVPSRGSGQKKKCYTSVAGAKFFVGDTVCIARSKNTCDYAKVEKVWQTKVDVTYLKKNNINLVPWFLSKDSLYTESVQINTFFFFNLGQTKYNIAD